MHQIVQIHFKIDEFEKKNHFYLYPKDFAHIYIYQNTCMSALSSLGLIFIKLYDYFLQKYKFKKFYFIKCISLIF